ncbi:Methionine ABC transporter ATP-binding protein [Enhygromyxa salina]|uniref:Methionine ABC transporter ATP-binding protein n=1 Tax=Enhygromyxa salina TaxID=215803 RepID=A0A0C2A778_9BACT|nr:hypothetical protein [Enhygromyxa salina]KIG19293.1 Methionine ABC transporter ATP-binding protein [Enhygromyxa salina]
MKKLPVLNLMSVGVLLLSGCGDDSADGFIADGPAPIGTLDNGNDNGNSSETNGNDQGGDGDGDSGPGDGDGDPGDGDGDGDGGSADGGNHKWDTLSVPDGSMNCGGGGGNANEPEWSYLWAANSSQGTISKIDTKTVTEVGRYQVRPNGGGSPSRTSVSLSGHVAVASRVGGVTKIYADESFCEESNGMPGIQTSNSAAFLPWGEEECVAWHTPFNYQTQRPVAWGPGEFNQGTCQWEDEELWTAGSNGQGIDVMVLDGDDGSIKEMINVPTGGNGMAADFYGIYGGAVDGDGNFWGSQLGSSGKLLKVNREDMTYTVYNTPNDASWYGMTVDEDGMVWLCRNYVARFDPVLETWTTASTGGYTGCMADVGEDGLLWQASSGNQGVIGVNRDTLQVEKSWPAGGAYGISIDFEGYVWAVANGSNVSKIDPETGQFQTYNGLVGAYTYSDMTGFALSSVGSPNG